MGIPYQPYPAGYGLYAPDTIPQLGMAEGYLNPAGYGSGL